jgi:hypothetical protein
MKLWLVLLAVAMATSGCASFAPTPKCAALNTLDIIFLSPTNHGPECEPRKEAEKK